MSGPLAHKDEEDVISYSGNAGGSVAVATITESVSPMLNYFEIKIVNKGERRCISVGVGSLGFPQVSQYTCIDIYFVYVYKYNGRTYYMRMNIFLDHHYC